MKFAVLLALLLILCCLGFAQNKGGIDSTYVSTFTGPIDLTGRLYSSVKYSRFWVSDRNINERLRYRTNTNFILGVGINYRRLAFNLGLNFPFINDDDALRGETKYLDFQGHYYKPNYTLDLWLSRYKGYFLFNSAAVTTQSSLDKSFLIRPDMVNTNFGISVMHVFNSKRYSFRAAFAHDEWQKKSAGSFLLGSDINVVAIKGDSSFVPKTINDPDFFDQYQLDRVLIYNLSMNAGYAYTLVLKKHFFIAVSVSGSIGISHTTLESDLVSQQETNGITHNFNLNVKAAIGYNSAKYFVGFTGVNSWLFNKTTIPGGVITQIPGNVRLHFVKRITLSKPIKLPLMKNRLTK